MKTLDLIGLPYRLGADPDKHQAADCLSLACVVLRNYGLHPPTPKREWYRRLRKGDYQVFEDELSRFCEQVTSTKVGVVALCDAPTGVCLATFFESGWLSFVESEVKWSPIGGLTVRQLYCLTK